ncbi:hypothetical protein [Muricoccus radiodurans]|uniref:hypothetical protein n=1 Tax=Muricoccus radiodurans TaxID=2231721 RepID=UPI003CFB285B
MIGGGGDAAAGARGLLSRTFVGENGLDCCSGSVRLAAALAPGVPRLRPHAGLMARTRETRSPIRVECSISPA